MTDPINTMRADVNRRARARKIITALIVVAAIALATVVGLTFLAAGG